MGPLLRNCSWCVAGSKAYLHSAANAIDLMLLQTKSVKAKWKLGCGFRGVSLIVHILLLFTSVYPTIYLGENLTNEAKGGPWKS